MYYTKDIFGTEEKDFCSTYRIFKILMEELCLINSLEETTAVAVMTAVVTALGL